MIKMMKTFCVRLHPYYIKGLQQNIFSMEFDPQLTGFLLKTCPGFTAQVFQVPPTDNAAARLRLIKIFEYCAKYFILIS
jgi:hypothetical protein